MADVAIATVDSATARATRPIVWVSASVGYCFYIAADLDLEYVKTTDGGATWGTPVQVSGNDTVQAFDVWFDQWTPGDTTGTKIHVGWVQAQGDGARYRSLDTASDTLGTNTQIVALVTVLGGSGVWCSVAKSVSGDLGFAFDADTGAERGFYISDDAGATWGSNLNTATFVEAAGSDATPDVGLLLPATGTGDGDDFWLLYQDGSANALTLKLWDRSGAADSESATIVTLAENATNEVGQRGWSAGIRLSDGHLILAAVTEYDTATADHRVFDITSVASFAELTAIATDKDDHYHPAVYIDPNDDEIFVAFNGLRDGSEDLGVATKIYYVSSSDGGTSWSAGSTAYMEGAAEAAAQVWCAPTGPLFYPVWRTGTALKGNAVNSVPGGGGGTPVSQTLTSSAEHTGAVVQMEVASAEHTGDGVISGTVVLDADSSPVEDAEVIAVRQSSGQVEVTGLTDIAGAFALDPVTPGLFDVYVRRTDSKEALAQTTVAVT